ncbi:hypothetical protein B0T10DRAFT_266681 [Thelonectria olida]|uniref:tRNA-splicing endonuclease subunit Sen2 n=1 Tax=Thelonectria olida TaxID=1576542 RepID=A0A9P8W7L3_9HYPO|nr:hypothetical protein B0T10DRAFT_266681 [Thelonectria olida]
MAELQPSTTEPGATLPPAAAQSQPPQQRGPPLHQIHALPAPIRTFPLPAFYPNNPISLFHLACAWLGQLWSPPLAEPSVVYEGVWSLATSSVHILNEKSIRALWEQGFYGKGNLSRSEPNWFKREQVRRGLQEAHVSEILTVQRREERTRAKWERARLEQEVIRQTRLKEAEETDARETEARNAQAEAARMPLETKTLVPVPPSPVTPERLVSLPNSTADLWEYVSREEVNRNGDQSSLDLSNGVSAHPESRNGTRDSSPATSDAMGNGHQADTDITSPGSPASSDDVKPMKRRKSVRFSPKIESTTFGLTDPPSPKLANSSADLSLVNSGQFGIPNVGTSDSTDDIQPGTIVNLEHLQLMPEEAFFLSFGLGVLKVTDPATGEILTQQELFTLFRQYSYFPPELSRRNPNSNPTTTSWYTTRSTITSDHWVLYPEQASSLV